MDISQILDLANSAVFAVGAVCTAVVGLSVALRALIAALMLLARLTPAKEDDLALESADHALVTAAKAVEGFRGKLPSISVKKP